MGRHVRALGHITDIAQVALVDDFPIILFVDTVYFAILGFVDQVKQRRERAAQVHAAPTAMTHVKDALHLRVQLVFVVEIRIGPVQGMPGGRLEIAFAV